jgi:hypothetical protein
VNYFIVRELGGRVWTWLLRLQCTFKWCKIAALHLQDESLLALMLAQYCHMISYVIVIGSKSKLPKRRLVKKPGPNSKREEDFEFKKGSTHVFKFDGADIGNVESIIIEVKIIRSDDLYCLDEGM